MLPTNSMQSITTSCLATFFYFWSYSLLWNAILHISYRTSRLYNVLGSSLLEELIWLDCEWKIARKWWGPLLQILTSLIKTYFWSFIYYSSTAYLTPIPLTRSPVTEETPSVPTDGGLRSRVEQHVDAITDSANKVISGVVDSSFGILRSFSSTFPTVTWMTTSIGLESPEVFFFFHNQ